MRIILAAATAVSNTPHVGVVLEVLVKEGPLGIHFLKQGILTKQGTYIMAMLGTGILNNYHVSLLGVCYHGSSVPVVTASTYYCLAVSEFKRSLT